jgi:membrane-bound lytic murein transglycosylase
MGVILEYSTAKGFIQALGNCDYYLGSGKAAGVAAPFEWHTLDIQGLLDKDIDVKRLSSK